MERCANCDQELDPSKYEGDSFVCPLCRARWSLKKLRRAHRYRRDRGDLARKLALYFEPNGTSHGDLILRLGVWAQRCDSYYFALDKRAEEKEDAKRSLRAMLEQWKHRVVAATLSFYLPYDFSDQSTAWIQGNIRDERISLVPGWSEREGWSFYPSSFADEEVAPTDFRCYQDVAPVQTTRSELLDDIAASLRGLP